MARMGGQPLTLAFELSEVERVRTAEAIKPVEGECSIHLRGVAARSGAHGIPRYRIRAETAQGVVASEFDW